MAIAVPTLERRQDQQMVLKPIADDHFKKDTGYQLIKLSKLPTSNTAGWEVAGTVARNVKLSKEANGWTISGQEAQGCYGWNTEHGEVADVAWWYCDAWSAAARLWNIRCAEGTYNGLQLSGATASGYMCTFFHGDSAEANCLGADVTDTLSPLQQVKGTCKVTTPAVDQILYVFPKGNA